MSEVASVTVIPMTSEMILASRWFQSFNEKHLKTNAEAEGLAKWIEAVLDDGWGGFPINITKKEIGEHFESTAFDYNWDEDSEENRKELSDLVWFMCVGMLIDNSRK